MKLKRRKKSSRMQGSVTHGHGARKKNRGSGSKGGKGMAGTGKRADQKKTLILTYEKPYFGKHGFPSRKKKLKVINLDDLEEIARKTGKKEVNLKNYKILGDGSISTALIITASAFSKSAEEKIKKAGGSVIIETKKENKEK